MFVFSNSFIVSLRSSGKFRLYGNTPVYLDICVFIDFSRAFDCIDHSILIAKLKLYGLDTKAISFISSYFNNRYQHTN